MVDRLVRDVDHLSMKEEIRCQRNYMADLMKGSSKLADFCNQVKLQLNDDDQSNMGRSGETQLVAKDFKSLKNAEYVNDSIIFVYLKLIQVRSDDPIRKLPKIHVVQTHFYETWTKRGYDGVKNWFRKVKLFDYQIIFFPIYDSNHWSMVTVDLERKKIIYYDPLPFKDAEEEDVFANQYVIPVRNFIDAEAQTKRNEANFSENFMYLIQNQPAQANVIDCGVFVCQFANVYARRKVIHGYSQDDMIDIRTWMIMELSCGSLFND